MPKVPSAFLLGLFGPSDQDAVVDLPGKMLPLSLKGPRLFCGFEGILLGGFQGTNQRNANAMLDFKSEPHGLSTQYALSEDLSCGAAKKGTPSAGTDVIVKLSGSRALSNSLLLFAKPLAVR